MLWLISVEVAYLAPRYLDAQHQNRIITGLVIDQVPTTSPVTDHNRDGCKHIVN